MSKKILTISLAVLVGAVVLYTIVGPEDASTVDEQLMAVAASLSPDQPSIPVQTLTRSPSSGKAAPVGSLVTGLEQRLSENPDDGKGWLLLAKSYDHLGDPERARSAYERAVELGYRDAAMDDLFAGNY